MAQATDQEMVVRVGYDISENFQEGEQGQRKYGYGYEYLQKVSYYTGWRYEYVYGNFTDLLAMLEQDEIDLLPNLDYTQEQAETVFYSDSPEGQRMLTLYTYEGGKVLDSEDFSTFQGIRVGVRAACDQKSALEAWCEERDIQCEIIVYEDNNQRIQDLENGTLDAVVANREYTENPWVPVVQVGESTYYFGVSQSRPDLLEQLNEAMAELLQENPYYNDELRIQYTSTTSAAQRTITQQEQEYLDKTPEIRIGYLENFMPYCYIDQETGEADGLLADLLTAIKREYSQELENTAFTTVAYSTYQEMRQALDDGLVDAVFPCYGDLNVGETEEIMFTEPVTTTTMTLFNKETAQQDVSRIAIWTDGPLQSYYAQIYYPDAVAVYYEDLNSCVQAVADGDVEFTIVETALATTVPNSLKSKVQHTDLLQTMDLCLAVSWGSRDLRCILSKGILSLDSSTVQNSLIYHSRNNVSYTRMDFLRDHMVETLVIVITIFLVVIGLLLLIFLNHSRSQKRICDAEVEVKSQRWRAEHDALTGLQNRAALQKLSQQYEKSDKPLGLMICDVDYFKAVNDTYGHEVGDQVLIKVAKLLQQTFRNVDSVIRYAGDEFVVLMVQATPEGKNVIGEKIDVINQVLQNPDDQLPQLSISAGIAFSPNGYGEDLLQNADQALYRTKAAGRCGYTFYED
jgi:diguanylate cyclase (GGDEF)-like protein